MIKIRVEEENVFGENVPYGKACANIEDSDQTVCSAQSNQILHCLKCQDISSPHGKQSCRVFYYEALRRVISIVCPDFAT